MDYKKLKVNAFEKYMNDHVGINLRKFLIDDLEILTKDPFIPVKKTKRHESRKATDFFIKRAKLFDDSN